MRAPDRGGGRESKLGSLRQAKRNAADAARLLVSTPKVERPSHAPPLPPLVPLPTPRAGVVAPVVVGPFVDACVLLASRQFDRDRDAVLRRACEAQVQALVVSSSDVDKQEEVLALCRAAPGVLFAAVGALADNVKRTNTKQAENWAENATDAALSEPCVAALQAGLNMSREAATHHAQTALFSALYRAARAVRKPLVVHAATGSLLRVSELISSLADEQEDDSGAPLPPPPRVALHNAAIHAVDDASLDCLSAWCASPFGYVFITACAISEPASDASTAAAASRVGRLMAAHPGRVCLASAAPQHTPQTLEDAYLRTLRNEPSTLPQVAADAASAAGVAASETGAFARQLFANALRFYGLAEVAATQAADEAPDAAVQASASQPIAAAPVQGHEPRCAAADDAPVAPAAPSEIGGATTDAAPPAYACRRCRTRLFLQSSAVQHSFVGADASEALLSDANACVAAVFVPLPAAEAALGSLRLACAAADDGRLACAACGTKLGRWSAEPAPCACGVHVAGPVAKLVTSKLDLCDARALASGVAAMRLERDAAAADDVGDGLAAKGKKKAPKLRGDNRNNLSSYRD